MIRTLGSTALIALEAVAIDTETTSLDTAAARIVQFGAVAISKGRTLRERAFETLVDPGVPVPSASTAIHGIGNAAVRNAPDFAAAWAACRGFVGGRVLVGHSIGFDLAVIEKDCARAGLAWERPRTLCIRLLGSIANPRLPDNSLDTLASWLGVAIAGRHQAPGDALAAAEIFVALLPLLADRGIRTLAEAERACLQLTDQLESQHRSGWTEPVTRPDAVAPAALGAVDPFAYRHRIGELMSAPPVILRGDASARAAVALMVERRIGAVFVSASGEPGAPVADYGIVTERDVMRRIAAAGASALDEPVDGFASRPLASIRAAAFVYRAVGRMDRLRIRHLAVRDEAGRLAGIVSARDLLRLRAGAAISLDDRIVSAVDAGEMAAAWATLPAVANALIAEDLDARTIAEIVSEELRLVTRRAAEIGEAEMAAAGLGPPPCPYAVMVLGSGGRGESLLAADQDNAIVFADGEPGGDEDRWFAALGTRMADILDRAGVPYCKGGVMAKNPQWRGSLATWRERITGWVARSRPEDLLDVDIFFDLVPVHGEAGLAQELFDLAYERGSAGRDFAKLLGERLSARSNPFTLLGGFATENGRLDLKLHGLFPAVAFARTLAIRHDLRLRSTRQRLEALMALGLGGDADFARILAGHATLLRLMLAQQSRDLFAGIPVSNRVATGALSREEQAELKAALKAMQIVPDLVRDLMFG